MSVRVAVTAALACLVAAPAGAQLQRKDLSYEIAKAQA